MSGPGTSSGLQDTMRTNGTPWVTSAGKRDDVVLDDRRPAAGAPRISRSCGSQYRAPSMSACHVGCMNVASCSIVGSKELAVS